MEFLTEEYGFTVRFYRHCGEGWKESKAPKRQNEALDEALNEALENRILAVIETEPGITQTKLADQLMNSRATIQRIIKILVDKGTLKREGGKRYGYWNIRKD